MADPVEVELLLPPTLPNIEGGSVEVVSPVSDGIFGDFIESRLFVELTSEESFLDGIEPMGTSSGGLETIDVVAAEDLPAFTMVTVNGNIADSSNVTHYGKVVGITLASVVSGSLAGLIDDEEVTNLSWSWVAGQKLFLNGTALSITPPSSGFCQMVAVARNNNTIIMRIEVPILL